MPKATQHASASPGPIIAIDGPAASGKGTLAHKLGARLRLPVLDTGSLYRLIAYQALEAGIHHLDQQGIVRLAENPRLEWLERPELRSAIVGRVTPLVAQNAQVRKALLKVQRDFAHQPGGAILDGRDIGTVVCPDADVKLFVTADLDVRAKRRAKELRAQGERVSEKKLEAQLAERDERDATRPDSPLVQAPDAHLLDTTHLSIEAAVEAACRIVDAALARPGA